MPEEKEKKKLPGKSKGRPPYFEKPMKLISVLLRPEDIEWLNAQDKSRNETIRNLIEAERNKQ